jgi:hypothetical protein
LSTLPYFYLFSTVKNNKNLNIKSIYKIEYNKEDNNDNNYNIFDKIEKYFRFFLVKIFHRLIHFKRKKLTSKIFQVISVLLSLVKIKINLKKLFCKLILLDFKKSSNLRKFFYNQFITYL